MIRRREQPFRGSNTAQVKAAAAESDAPPPATPAAGGRGRRQRAEPTVDIATIKPGAVLEGTVVCIGTSRLAVTCAVVARAGDCLI